MENTTSTETETLRTVCFDSGVTLQAARYMTETERAQWAPWFAAIGLYKASEQSALSINHEDVCNILGRTSTNAFPGSNSRVWIITEAEEAALVSASDAKRIAIEKVRRDQDAEDAAITTSNTCPACGTHCYGDCTASR